jgi:hypothetical protein
MDGVSKDTMELLIRSCEALQERVVGPKLSLHLWHTGSVGIWTIGGGVVTLTVGNILWGYRHPGSPVVAGVAGCSDSNARKFLASDLRQHSCGWQQAVLLPLLQTLLIDASLFARWGCSSGWWRPRHLVGKGHHLGQTPEGGGCPASVLHQSMPMHQSHVPTRNSTGFGGAQQLAYCSATKPLPADILVGGLGSPPSGDIATASPSQEAPDKVEWVLSWR